MQFDQLLARASEGLTIIRADVGTLAYAEASARDATDRTARGERCAWLDADSMMVDREQVAELKARGALDATAQEELELESNAVEMAG